MVAYGAAVQAAILTSSISRNQEFTCIFDVVILSLGVETAGGTMTKADLADKVYEKVGLSRKEAVEMIETLFSSMKSILSEGESIKITGFGTFLVRKKSSRRGRNPKTGEEMEITARKVITFKPSLEFKAVVQKA